MRILTDNITHPCILRGERSEEQKWLRHLYGDKGQRFQGKVFRPATNGCSNTITTITKDNLLIEPI
ncbi:MAG: hypothetical protein KBT34_10565 [Prevotella sp.]|nr:hypothetical protein [Candidatus Prevotella equi]